MNYLLKAGPGELLKLASVFNQACLSEKVKIGPGRRMRIMVKFIELALERGLLVETDQE